MIVFAEIQQLLDRNRCPYTAEDHKPTPRSIDASRVRGTPIEQGAKAIVLRSSGSFLLCVLPGNKTIDFKKVRLLINAKSLSLATPEEVKQVTSCVIGSVPPFGRIFNIPAYIEKSILRNEYISFNAGMLTRSITMKTEDYIKIARGKIEEFAAYKS